MGMSDALMICPTLLDRIEGRKCKGVLGPMIHNPAIGSSLGVSNCKVLKKPRLNNFLRNPSWVEANEARRTLVNEDTREGSREWEPRGGSDRFSRNERAAG